MARLPKRELESGAPVRVAYPPFDVVVARVDGAYCAIEDACNHAGASLSEGSVDENGCIRCPMHGYLFDLSTGHLVAPKGLCDHQRRFVTAVEGDELVIWDPAKIVVF